MCRPGVSVEVRAACPTHLSDDRTAAYDQPTTDRQRGRNRRQHVLGSNAAVTQQRSPRRQFVTVTKVSKHSAPSANGYKTSQDSRSSPCLPGHIDRRSDGFHGPTVAPPHQTDPAPAIGTGGRTDQRTDRDHARRRRDAGGKAIQSGLRSVHAGISSQWRLGPASHLVPQLLQCSYHG